MRHRRVELRLAVGDREGRAAVEVDLELGLDDAPRRLVSRTRVRAGHDARPLGGVVSDLRRARNARRLDSHAPHHAVDAAALGRR